MDTLLFVQLPIYIFAIWFGLYLIAHQWQTQGMRYAGIGLLCYGVGIAFDILIATTSTENLPEYQRWRYLFLILPALLWSGAILHLQNEESFAQQPLNNLLLGNSHFPLIIFAYSLLVLFIHPSQQSEGIYRLTTVIPIILLMLTFGLFLRDHSTIDNVRTIQIIVTASIFFFLGMSLLIIPQEWLAQEWIVLIIGIDVISLGYAIVAWNAYDTGELFRNDLLRSFLASMILVLILGGQILVIMVIEDQLINTMMILLLTMIASVIAIQAFWDDLQTLSDKFAFSQTPELQLQRAELRATASAVTRLQSNLDVLQMTEKDFIRHTRRALSNMGDVGKLASNPLTQLPILEERLAQQSKNPNTLERATELRVLLTESIERLKPRENGAYGTTDEWRYYNALYYPYVMGLKPFSRRFTHDSLDVEVREILEWFRTYVPERTLYNWQNVAAKLIAQNLQEIHHEYH